MDLIDLFDGLIPVLGVICTIGLPITISGFIIVRALRDRHTERMEMLKQGIIPEKQPKAAPNKYRSLRNGFLCIGTALGLIAGILITETVLLDDSQSILIIVSSVLLFLGIAYTLFYVFTKDKNDLDGTLDNE